MFSSALNINIKITQILIHSNVNGITDFSETKRSPYTKSRPSSVCTVAGENHVHSSKSFRKEANPFQLKFLEVLENDSNSVL